jgi:hypothetical protein
MSWKDAKKTAAVWVDEMRLPANLTGKSIDLKKLAEKLPHQGVYREMVLRAATRLLRQRGAKVE